MRQDIQWRIRNRRKAFDASIEAMASWASLPAERWRAIENGAPLSVAELGHVARALAVEPGTLLRGEERSPRRTVARFRQAVPLPAPSILESRTLALAAELGRIGGALHRLLGKPLPLVNVRKSIPVSDREEPWRQGYRLGEAARRSLGIPVGPVIDLQKTLEAAAIHVATLPFSGADIDAASLMEEGAMPVLLLNQRSPRIARLLPRRAAMAHELCHLLHDAGEHDLETQMSRSEGSAQDDPAEQRARAFGPAFLAPREEVRHWFRSGSGRKLGDPEAKVIHLAKRWGLSWGGAVWHAKNCQLIRPATADRLAGEPSPRPDWPVDFERAEPRSTSRLPEGMEPNPLCRGKIAELVGEALEIGAISEGRAREILSWG